MGIITYIFIALAFVNATSCAPVDDSSVKPPASILSSSTTEASQYHAVDNKNKDFFSPSSSSEESKESSEVTKTRTARDNEHNGATAHQTKDLPPQGTILTPPAVTKESAILQLPARETRETNEQPAAPAILYAGYVSSTSSTPASTTAAKS